MITLPTPHSHFRRSRLLLKNSAGLRVWAVDSVANREQKVVCQDDLDPGVSPKVDQIALIVEQAPDTRVMERNSRVNDQSGTPLNLANRCTQVVTGKGGRMENLQSTDGDASSGVATGGEGCEVPGFRFGVAILGDSTLRLHRVAPPGVLNVTRSGSTATLTWNPSVDPGCVYYVYRSTNGIGGFRTPLNPSSPIQGLTFTDTNSAAGHLYQVRACRLQSTGAGSFWNTSQGTLGVTP